GFARAGWAPLRNLRALPDPSQNGIGTRVEPKVCARGHILINRGLTALEGVIIVDDDHAPRPERFAHSLKAESNRVVPVAIDVSERHLADLHLRPGFFKQALVQSNGLVIDRHSMFGECPFHVLKQVIAVAVILFATEALRLARRDNLVALL